MGANRASGSIMEAMGMEGQIEAVGLSAYCGATKVLDDVNMVIAPRTVTTLFGPAGAGKSTLLRTINRTHELVPGGRVAGTLTVGGVDVYAADVDVVALRHAVVGWVGEQPDLLPGVSIFENVVLSLRVLRIRRRAVLDEACERALRVVGLWREVKDRLADPPAGLSAGERQRLCIARAAAPRPPVILMDQPCAAVDPRSTLDIEDTIDRLRDSCTVVVVTHSMSQAARISDRSGFLSLQEAGDPGRLVEYDDATRMFSNPQQKSTDDYITGRFG